MAPAIPSPCESECGGQVSSPEEELLGGNRALAHKQGWFHGDGYDHRCCSGDRRVRFVKQDDYDVVIIRIVGCCKLDELIIGSSAVGFGHVVQQ
jgi:hypothetical protein